MAKMTQVPYQTKRYFTNDDNANLIYFQFPKLLMYGERYKKMSGDGKLFYMLCLDLIKLSMKKGWKDEYGRYYIKISIETIKVRMNCQNTKAVNLKKELAKYELMEVMRMGQGKADRLYILQLDYTDSDIYKANNDHEDIENDEDKSSGIVGDLEAHENSEKQNSRIPKSGELEFRKAERIKNLSFKTNSIKNIDDDDNKRVEISDNETEVNLIISNLRESTKDELTERSFKSIVRKVVDKHDQGKVNSFRDYLATALIKKIEDLELRRTQDDARKEIPDSDKVAREERIKNTDVTRKIVPFYNWLEERE